MSRHLKLTEATVPRSFRERFHEQLARWGPAATRGGESGRDEAIIREGLSPPDRPLLAEVDWLLSPAAVRSMSFALTLGRVDVEHVLLRPMVERTRAGASPVILSRYCVGMSEAGREQEVDSLLAEWQSDSSLAGAAALAMTRLDGNDRRAAYLANAVQRGLVPEAVLWALTWGQWSNQISSGVLEMLLTALLDQPSAAARTAALELILDRLDAQPQEADLGEPLLRAMELLADEPLVGMAAYAWERGGKKLVEMGALPEVCRLSVRGILTLENPVSEHHWFLVQACEERAPGEFWKAVQTVLERGGQSAVRLVADLRWRAVGSRFPVDAVLDWVGRNLRRASLAAAFASVHSDILPGVARGLISRFGADSRPARDLAAAMSSTLGVVSSLAEFDRKQLARARSWQQDTDPEVRTWAESHVGSLERSEEFHAAYEEHERRRFGT